MSAANDDQIDTHQDLTVALHARYLLALKGHRRGAFWLGFFFGVMATSMAWHFAPQVSALLARL